MSICKASEIPRNEAYIEVRRSDEGWAMSLSNGRWAFSDSLYSN
jgi:hypothetical protein